MLTRHVVRRSSFLHSSLARCALFQIKSTPCSSRDLQLWLDTTHKTQQTYQRRCVHCKFPQLHKQDSDKGTASSGVEQNDEAIPFLHSKAHKFKVDDAYSVDTAKDRSRQRFALPLGATIFFVIIYFGFVRDYGTKDKSIVGFLTKDIGDKLPDDVREKMKRSDSSDQTLSESSDTSVK